MRLTKIFLFGLLLGFFIIFVFADWQEGPEPDCSKGNCGKVIGWIFDTESNKPVEEEFYVSFCDCHIKIDFDTMVDKFRKYTIKSDKNGYFSSKLPEGKYCLQIWPKLDDSKYSYEPEPVYKNENLQVVQIKRNQVTTVKKTAKYGGCLKIILVNKNNNPINPLNIYDENISIIVQLTSQKVSPILFVFPPHSDEEGFNDGEGTVYRLYPDLYDVYIELENMGYGTQKIPAVEIESKKTSEIRVVVDENNQTGIEGFLKDTNNNPLPNIEVSVISYEDLPYIVDGGSTITESNGYYKINGLKEQKYKLEIYGVVGDIEVEKEIDNIIIRNNILLKKDIVVDY